MEKKEAEEKVKGITAEDRLDYAPASLPIAPDGGIVPGAFLPNSDTPRDFEKESICAYGDCRHYWRIETPMDTLVPETYAELGLPEPRQIVRACLVHPGTETELSGDTPIYSCNRYEPLRANEIGSRRQCQKTLEDKRKNHASDQTGPR